MIPIENKEQRIDWNAVRSEYIKGGTTYRELSEKYGIKFSTIQQRAAREKWSDKRNAASIKIEQSVISKTADKTADNATLVADIKRKGLIIIANLFEKFVDMESTERRETHGNTIDIKRLRDLTAAFKDLTEDMPKESGSNELLESLLSMERRHGND